MAQETPARKSRAIDGDPDSIAAAVSNRGRWGEADERGTLNLISPDVRRAALALIKSAEVVPLGLPLAFGTQAGPARWMTLGDEPASSAQEVNVIAPHGFDITHLDAVGHSFMAGRLYNGRAAAAVLSPDGLAFGSVAVAAGGIITRGVLLDVAAAKGVPHLGAGAGISGSDLEECEGLLPFRVRAGDAIFIRSGLALRQRATGPCATREGVLPDTLLWLRDRDVAVYSGDCIERLPSDIPSLPTPVHQIGMAHMGLWFLDNPDVERLAAACRNHGSAQFALVICPLNAPGGTASVVNPLAIF